jgi:hypothetical protein
LDALARVGEDTRLDRQDDPVAWGKMAKQGAAGRIVAPHIVSMAAAACAVQILMSRPTEAVYDIERASAGGDCGRARKRGDAEGLPGTWHTEALYCDARLSRIDSSRVGFVVSCEDGHVFARPREFMSDLPRDIFDSAGTRREPFDYDCDAQCGNPLAFSREYPLRLALASEPQVRRIPPH